MSVEIRCESSSGISWSSEFRSHQWRTKPRKNHERPGTFKFAKIPSNARWISLNAWVIEYWT